MPFTPNHGLPIEERLRRLEAALANLDGRLNTFNDFGLPGVDGAEGVAPYPAAVGGEGGGGGGGDTLTEHDLLGDYHGDTVKATPVAQDLIYANASGLWDRFAKSATNNWVLKTVAGVLQWAQVAFSEISGSITAAQHGNLASVAGSTADHSGTLSANARLQAQKNGTNVGSPRPTFNFAEGNGIVLTVSDNGTVLGVTVAANYAVVTTTETSFGQSPSTGTSPLVARADHTHGTPADPIPAHVLDSDPHTQYQLESEKDQANGYPSLDSSGYVPVSELGSGTPDSTKFLRGDGQWASPGVSPGTIGTLVVPLMADGNIQGWGWSTGPTELFGTSNYRFLVDLSNYTEARLLMNVTTAVANGTLRAQYSTDGGSSWNYLDGGTGPELTPSSTGVKTSSWVTLDAGALTEVLLRVVGVNGTSVVLSFTNIHLLFR